MLRMARFEVRAPETVEAALDALATPGARALAGGTDLLPNLKRRLEAPPLLVSLHRLEALRRIEVDEDRGALRVGCGVTLARLAADERVRELAPMLAEAAASVASPQIRNTATLGGNVHLDTRCRYVSQSAFWRAALGGCLKSGGEVCHVVEKGRRCVAALSSDTVPALVALDASIVLARAGGAREVPLASYFGADGVRHVGSEPGELATEVRVPLASGPRRTAYVKWRPRGSIDFPLVSLALRLDLDESALVAAGRVVLGALGPRPRVVPLTEAALGLAPGDPALAEEVSRGAFERAKPLANLPYDVEHRRHLVRVLARRAVLALGARRA